VIKDKRGPYLNLQIVKCPLHEYIGLFLVSFAMFKNWNKVNKCPDIKKINEISVNSIYFKHQHLSKYTIYNLLAFVRDQQVSCTTYHYIIQVYGTHLVKNIHKHSSIIFILVLVV